MLEHKHISLLAGKTSMLVAGMVATSQTNAEVEAMMGGAGGDDQLIQSLSNNPL